jgi:hypothetical protein
MIKKLIVEKIYGMQAVVYHRTKTEDIVKGIIKQGFKIGSGAMYGAGVYCTYDLNSQLNSEMFNTYGPIIVKFAVYIQDFLILDYSVSRQLYGKNYTLVDQLKKKNIKITDEKIESYSKQLETLKFSSDVALIFYGNFKVILNKFKGLIFTGRRDGAVLVSYDSNILIPLSFCETDTTGRNIIKPWEKVLNKETLKRYVIGKSNVQNKILTPLEKLKQMYDSIISKDNFFIVKKNNKYGLLDKNFKLVIPVEYDLIYFYDNDYFKVKKNNKFGIYDKNSKLVIPVEYDDVDIYNGNFKVQKNNKYGLYDKNFKLVIPVEYDLIYFYDNDFFIVKKNNKYGLLDKNFKLVIPVEYDLIYFYDNDYFKVKKNNKFGIYDKNSKLVIPVKYDYIYFDYDNGNFKVEKDGKVILLDKITLKEIK